MSRRVIFRLPCVSYMSTAVIWKHSSCIALNAISTHDDDDDDDDRHDEDAKTGVLEWTQFAMWMICEPANCNEGRSGPPRGGWPTVQQCSHQDDSDFLSVGRNEKSVRRNAIPAITIPIFFSSRNLFCSTWLEKIKRLLPLNPGVVCQYNYCVLMKVCLSDISQSPRRGK